MISVPANSVPNCCWVDCTYFFKDSIRPAFIDLVPDGGAIPDYPFSAIVSQSTGRLRDRGWVGASGAPGIVLQSLSYIINKPPSVRVDVNEEPIGGGSARIFGKFTQHEFMLVENPDFPESSLEPSVFSAYVNGELYGLHLVNMTIYSPEPSLLDTRKRPKTAVVMRDAVNVLPKQISQISGDIEPNVSTGPEVLNLFGQYNLAIGVGEGLGPSVEYLDGELL